MKLERRVVRELYGDGHEGLDALLGREAMNSYVNTVGLNDKRTSLVTPLKDGEDPDDYFSCIPYEKGYNLLMLLEQHVRADYNADFHRKLFDVSGKWFLRDGESVSVQRPVFEV